MKRSWADDDDENVDEVGTPTVLSVDTAINKSTFSDKYNERGQNITSQSRRQELEPWVTVESKCPAYNFKLGI
jgi:hypothetical protein